MTNSSMTTLRQRLTSLAVALLILSLAGTTGCSVKGYTTRLLADALSQSGSTYASDEDIELVGAATPFALKSMELVLSEQPEHRDLLLAASRAFTQYAYLYVEWPAEQLEEHNLSEAYHQRERALHLYLRARDYGLRGLEVEYPGFSTELYTNPDSTIAQVKREDTELLYWTAVSWAAAVNAGKDDPYLVADIPVLELLIDRALELDEAFDLGSIHIFLIRYEMIRQGGHGDSVTRARKHFERALELTSGTLASPYLAWAEAVSVPRQDRAEFEQMLNLALEVDINKIPARRLENLAMQDKADWLLNRVDRYIAD